MDEARDGVGSTPGVLQLLDERAEVLLIVGLPDMAQGLEQALGELGAETVAYVLADVEMMYTQRESELLTLYARRHGRLPRGNDLGDDLYDDEDC